MSDCLVFPSSFTVSPPRVGNMKRMFQGLPARPSSNGNVQTVTCPICSQPVPAARIIAHVDGCTASPRRVPMCPAGSSDPVVTVEDSDPEEDEPPEEPPNARTLPSPIVAEGKSERAPAETPTQKVRIHVQLLWCVNAALLSASEIQVRLFSKSRISDDTAHDNARERVFWDICDLAFVPWKGVNAAAVSRSSGCLLVWDCRVCLFVSFGSFVSIRIFHPSTCMDVCSCFSVCLLHALWTCLVLCVFVSVRVCVCLYLCVSVCCHTVCVCACVCSASGVTCGMGWCWTLLLEDGMTSLRLLPHKWSPRPPLCHEWVTASTCV